MSCSGVCNSVSSPSDPSLRRLSVFFFFPADDGIRADLVTAVQTCALPILHVDTVTVPTCTTVMRQGYRHKDRLLRPAMVGVTDPTVFEQVQEDGQPIVEANGTEPAATTDSDDAGTNAPSDDDAVPAQPESSNSE